MNGWGFFLVQHRMDMRVTIDKMLYPEALLQRQEKCVTSLTLKNNKNSRITSIVLLINKEVQQLLSRKGMEVTFNACNTSCLMMINHAWLIEPFRDKHWVRASLGNQESPAAETIIFQCTPFGLEYFSVGPIITLNLKEKMKSILVLMRTGYWFAMFSCLFSLFAYFPLHQLCYYLGQVLASQFSLRHSWCFFLNFL